MTDRQRIAALCKGRTQNEVAILLGCSRSCVYRMVKRPIGRKARLQAAERLQRQQLKISRNAFSWDVAKLNRETARYSAICALWVLRTVAIGKGAE